MNALLFAYGFLLAVLRLLLGQSKKSGVYCVHGYPYPESAIRCPTCVYFDEADKKGGMK